MSLQNTHFGPVKIGEMLEGCRTLFFIGIGGINMSSLAELALARGFAVSGSDRTRTALTDELTRAGIKVYYTHSARHLTGVGAVVYTNAIGEDNPEYAAAVKRGLPCISRADFMGYLMRGFTKRIGVAGMHGKSTCTSMLSEIFLDGKTDPTILCGARLRRTGSAYRIGKARKYCLFEACEYMDSFLDFCPNIAVILNIEEEHMDYFSSIEQIRVSFGKYAALVGARGHVVANADDANVRMALEGCRAAVTTFAVNTRRADFTAINLHTEEGKPCFDIMRGGDFFCHVSLGVPGRHNVYNALAATAAASLCGISPEVIAAALGGFMGASRRMEYKGKFCGADVYDDYGHHPTEVRATLEGASKMGYDRVFCVFQPHTYSRLASLYPEFLTAFDDADRVVIAETYAAREVNTYDVTAETLARDLGQKAEYFDSFPAIADFLRQNVFPGDLVVVMGAGDIYKLFAEMGLV